MIPTPDEIRAARAAAGHTQTEAGAIVWVAMRTWQDWESGARSMPAAAWELYMVKTGRHPDYRPR